MTLPYTYLLKHKPSKKFYYGVRFAKNCHPNEFLKSYFTSSKIIKKLIKDNGIDDFEFEIRKTFNDVNSARKWETKVLIRLNVIHRNDFFNKTNNIAIAPMIGIDNPQYGKPSPIRGVPRSIETKQKISNSKKGKSVHTKDSRQKISNAKKGKSNGPLSEETKKKLSIIKKGKACHTEESKQKISKSKKGKISPNKSKSIHTEESKLKLRNSHIGKKHSEESKKKMSESRKGKKIKRDITTEYKKKMSESCKNIENITCEYCGKTCNPGNYNRWHNKNCKNFK